ncbi:MAG: DNA primase [Patescibacteria group bacterium]
MASSPEVQEIKDKIDIADFIGEYLRLSPGGTGIFKASCPFHNEKTPSFIVSPVRQSFHCFGCGAGGDVFEFLMKIENLEFPEALKVLAQKAGVTLSHQNREQLSRKNRLYDLCDLAAKYWHKVLLDSPQAQAVREYLTGRGLNDESIEQFRLGYAIDSWSNLTDFLLKRGYKEQEIIAAGLAIKKERGGASYDRFRHRLIFPIVDHHGRTVGFGGRALKADEPAKYLNSPQTEIYNKSETLYGSYQAKEAIRQAGECILVEGYMDVIPSHQAGVRNVVSISGTALTEQQLKNLKRYAGNLALSLDMDEAGQRAALRSIELALQSEMNVRVITLPEGKDPGECATKNPSAWRQAIAGAESVMEYFHRRAVQGRNLDSPEDLAAASDYLAEKINKIGNAIIRDYWFREYASRLRIDETTFRQRAAKLALKSQNPPQTTMGPKTAYQEGPNSASQGSTDAVSDQKAINSPDLIVFRRILAIVWAYPDLLAKLAERLPADLIPDDLLRGIYNELILFYTKNNGLFTVGAGERKEQSIFDQFISQIKTPVAGPPAQNSVATADQSGSVLAMLEQSYLLAQKDFFALPEKEAAAEFDHLLRLLKRNYLKSNISRLKFDLERAEKSGDKPAAEKIYLELSELIKQISVD